MTRRTAFLLEAFVLILGVGVCLAVISPMDNYMGVLQKIMYVHVPMVVSFGACLAWLSIGSWLYLGLKVPVLDSMNRATASVAIVVGLLGLATGSLWGRPTWGAYWQWDPRLVSTALMAIFVIAMHLLRESLEDSDKGPTLTAALGSLTIVGYGVIHLSVNWWPSLHQQATVIRPDGPKMHGLLLAALLVNMLAWVGVTFCLIAIRTRYYEVKKEIADLESQEDLEASIGNQ